MSRKRSLGSWFPNASLSKTDSAAYEEVSICLFYQYVRPLWSESRKKEAVAFVEQLAESLNIGGRVRVAQEGINATISSSHANVRLFTTQLGEFDAHFKETDFKYVDLLPKDRAFKDLKVMPVQEIVFYGIAPEDALGPGGVHLDANAYHARLGCPDTVVIDVRNAYESDIGCFGGGGAGGAAKGGSGGGAASAGGMGAQLLIPNMRKSTDFPEWIEREETRAQLEGKNVLMYCTGGVRCERASSLLKSRYGDNIQEVYQLQGGIESYLQAFPEGGYWVGKNYVFDKREAIGTEAGKKGAAALVMGRCCVCCVPWDRYIGKKKCHTCGVPVLLCAACCSAKGMMDKGGEGEQGEQGKGKEGGKKEGKEGGKSKGKDKKAEAAAAQKAATAAARLEALRMLRCPLCLAEGITVPVDQIILTENGKKGFFNGVGGGEGSFSGG
ncbi:hypothetical protein B484DRAFT_351190, partial [Ochromonadaceae sp. CCMP2298]